MKLAAQWLELTVAVWAMWALLCQVKLRGFGVRVMPAWPDLMTWAAGALAVVGAWRSSPWAGVAASVSLCALLTALWLDAALFHVFTIELGPGGAAGVVPSTLYGELMGMRRARRLFKSEVAFTSLPLAAGVAQAAVLKGDARARVLAAMWMGLASWALVEGDRGPLPCSSASRKPRLLASLWRPRARAPAVQLKPPHQAALLASASPFSRTSASGLLRGADVLLYTFESLGLAHVGRSAGAGARPRAQMPCLESLLSRGVRSAHHFCVCPLTNESHVALYASHYRQAPAGGPARALAAAGYQLLYLTSVATREYGLRTVLERAGFEVVDRDSLRGARPPHAVTDAVLAGAGLDAVEARRDGRPLFLHIHTGDTHLPYRVGGTDGRALDDRERYLRSLEAAYAHLASLLASFQRRALGRNLLLIVSADHGQSFGEMGYWSHGSAVTREQMLVPFAMQHPSLPAREVRFSSHFDVLPTALDLLGVEPLETGRARLGRSLFAEDFEPRPLVLWAGRPSRSSASNYGLVLGDRKWMVDSVLDRVHEMGWNDEAPRLLEGEERAYVRDMVTWALCRQGLG